MNEYMLVARTNDGSCQTMTGEERALFMSQFTSWTEDLIRKNLFIRADELSVNYKKVQQKQSLLQVTDGPFAETKEAISGYFLIRAENMDRALEITKACPILRFDNLEIYEVKGGTHNG